MPTREELRQTESHTPELKRPKPNTDHQQQQLADLQAQSASAIASLAQAGVNTINAQVFAFDARLTRFERETAKGMAQRLKQSQLRIQQYLAEELSSEPQQPQDFAQLIDAALEPPDLTSSFLTIAPTSIAGCLPL